MIVIILGLSWLLLLFSYALDSETIYRIYTISFVFVCIAVFSEKSNLRYKLSDSIVVSSFMLWFHYPSFFVSLGGFNTNIEEFLSRESFFLSFIIIHTAILLYFISSRFFRANVPSVYSYINLGEVEHKLLYQVGLVLFILGTLNIFYGGVNLTELVNVFTVGGRNFVGGKVGSNISTSMSDSFGVLFESFQIGAAMLFTYMSFSKDLILPRRTKVLIKILALVGVLMIILGGNRSRLILVIFPVFISLYFMSKDKVRIALILIPSLFSIIFLSQLMMQSRAIGLENVSLRMLVNDSATMNGTLDFISESAFAVDQFYEDDEKIFESNFLLFSTALVPRSILPNKPTTKVIEQYTLKRWGVDVYAAGGGNVFPGISGQLYISDGLLAFVTLGSFIFIVSYAATRFTPVSEITYLGLMIPSYILTWFFTNMRVLAPTLLFPIIFMLIFIYIGKKRWKL